MQKIRNFSLDQAIRATAGAGKTTGLISAVESCYKSHLQSNGVVPYILLTTFTIKAANELSERILDYALKKEDKNFLSYVSSHFLEIGTMHSTFMKVLSHISNEEVEENLKSFESTKLFYAKKIVHKVVKEVDCDQIFELVGDDKDLARFFIKFFDNNYLSLSFVSKEKLILKFMTFLESAIQSGPELYVADIKNLFNQINVFKASHYEEFFNQLDSFRDSMLLKVSQKCKRDEKAYYRSVVKILDYPEADKNYLDTYSLVHSSVVKCYQLWKLEYESLLETKLGFGISDIEWRLFQNLEEREEKFDLWDFCFFDEYQDTNPIQKRVIEKLTQNTPCYFVGDPFQSIYYFRGARKSIFLNDFDTVNKQGGRAEFRLDNYRSSPQVVDFVNMICTEKLSDFQSMVSKKDLKGEVIVFHNEEAALEDEINFVYSKIKDVDLSKESFAVLSRNAKELMLCARTLKSRGIDVSVSLSKSFENSLEVVDLCSILRFIHFPNDNLNFLSLARSPWFDVTDEEIKGIVGKEKIVKKETEQEVSYWTLFQEFRSDSFFHKLLKNFETQNSNDTIANFLVYSNFLDSSDFLDRTGKRELNIWKFLGILQTEEDRPEFDAGAFIYDILNGLYPLEKDSSEPDSGCLLMTVHASKGLQFDHVFILAANKSFSHKTGSLIIDEENEEFGLKIYDERTQKRTLPNYFSEVVERDKLEVAEESRRLLYVAMTRAVENLYISGSGSISKNPYEPSWLKIILDFKDQDGFTLISDADFNIENGLIDKNIDPVGFLLNKEIQEKVVDESSAVTKIINEDSEVFESDRPKVNLSNLSKNIVRGTLFHEFVERSGANGDLKSKVNNFFEYEIDDNHRAFSYLKSQDEFPFNELMISGDKEWGFDYINDDGEFSSGKIDLWGIHEDQLWIVDFKTGQTRFLEKGFKQLEFYSGVLKVFLGRENIKTNIVLTFPFNELTKIKKL